MDVLLELATFPKWSQKTQMDHSSFLQTANEIKSFIGFCFPSSRQKRNYNYPWNFFHIIRRRTKKKLFLTPALPIQTWKWKCLFTFITEVEHMIQLLLPSVAKLLLISVRTGLSFCWQPDQFELWQWKERSEPRDWKTTHKNVEKHITKIPSYHICGCGNHIRGSK